MLMFAASVSDCQTASRSYYKASISFFVNYMSVTSADVAGADQYRRLAQTVNSTVRAQQNSRALHAIEAVHLVYDGLLRSP